MQSEHNTNVEDIRKVMGTMPHMDTKPETKFHIGVEGIEVEMIDHTVNPYKTIFEAVTATWGSEDYTQKWDDITPVRRFDVVKTALSGQTLPQALEPVQFMFLVRGASRSAFDQHARARVGAGFFSQQSLQMTLIFSRESKSMLKMRKTFTAISSGEVWGHTKLRGQYYQWVVLTTTSSTPTFSHSKDTWQTG